MATKIQIRGGTSGQWTSANPVLANREPAIETDTLKMKVGDGSTAWNSLAYVYMVATGGDASETVKGFVEEATNAEALAGTATGATGAKLFVTPAKLSYVLTGLTEGRVAVAISASTLTLDCNSYRQRNFDLTSTVSADFTLALSNTTNLLRARLTFRVTGTVLVTMPSAFVMDANDYYTGRWNQTTNVLTLTGASASPFMFEIVPDSAGNFWLFSSGFGL